MMKCVDCGTEIKQKKGKHKLTTPFPENYGIIKYTKLQKRLHTDIMKVIEAKHLDIGADDCMIVFSRIYGTWIVAELKHEGKLKMLNTHKQSKVH